MWWLASGHDNSARSQRLGKHLQKIQKHIVAKVMAPLSCFKMNIMFSEWRKTEIWKERGSADVSQNIILLCQKLVSVQQSGHDHQTKQNMMLTRQKWCFIKLTKATKQVCVRVRMTNLMNRWEFVFDWPDLQKQSSHRQSSAWNQHGCHCLCVWVCNFMFNRIDKWLHPDQQWVMHTTTTIFLSLEQNQQVERNPKGNCFWTLPSPNFGASVLLINYSVLSGGCGNLWSLVIWSLNGWNLFMLIQLSVFQLKLNSTKMN